MNIEQRCVRCYVELLNQEFKLAAAKRENPSGMFGCRYADELAALNPSRLHVARELLRTAMCVVADSLKTPDNPQEAVLYMEALEYIDHTERLLGLDTDEQPRREETA